MIRITALAALVLMCFVQSTDRAAATEQDRGSASGERGPIATEEAPGPGRVHKAVSGYIDGMHWKDDKAGKKGADRTRFRPDSADVPDGQAEELRRVLSTESALAETRMQRHEWDTAVNALDRAVQAAERLSLDKEAEKLKELRQDALLKASRGTQGPPSAAAEITNSIGMRFVTIQPGTFLMGSSLAETRRVEAEWNVERNMIEQEGPVHAVQISTPFLMGKYEVTVGQFRQFADQAGYKTVAEKQGWGWVYDEAKKHWVKKSGASWRSPGYRTADDHPVTLVCHKDAEAFCEWLSKQDNRHYELPTEARWEF
ncbi:MAG: SUMF1/EgtB/PvdO family nonheme iron enzyme, partial [Pseudomonadota bacterium]